MATTVAALEARIAALEAAAVPAPLVLVPPITIGELTTVPAPGSQIAAAWAQDVSSRVVQRFPSTTALKAWAAPNGAIAVALDTGVEWRRIASAWSQVTPWTSAIGGGTTIVAGPSTLATITVPADPGPRIIAASCLLRVDKYTPSDAIIVNLVCNESIQGRWEVPKLGIDVSGFGGTIPYFVALQFTNYPAPPAGTTVRMDIQTPTAAAGKWAIRTESYWNRLDVMVTPRGY